MNVQDTTEHAIKVVGGAFLLIVGLCIVVFLLSATIVCAIVYGIWLVCVFLFACAKAEWLYLVHLWKAKF